MMTFSRRYNYEPILPIQYESMNQDLLNSICNFLEDIWTALDRSHNLNGILTFCWTEFFKLPLYEIKDHFSDQKLQIIRNLYYKFIWHKVYSFLEFLEPIVDTYLRDINFVEDCNLILERENSAYRFINKQITPITSDIQIETIKHVLAERDEASVYIESALTLFSNREVNQARESIAQSISAVEAIAKKITGKTKATLSDLLNEKMFPSIHPQLLAGFKNLYIFTSDKDGIRHSLTTESVQVSKSLALFMLVSCSAFINLIKDNLNQRKLEGAVLVQ